MPRGKIVAAGLAGILSAPALVYGQGNSALGDPPESVLVRLGPLALAPTISLTNFGWDSNVFLEDVDADPEGDFTTTVRPQVEGWLRLGRARMHGRSTLDFVYFQKHPSERSVDGFHEGQLALPLAFMTPYVSERWLSAKQRFGFEIDERTRRHEETRTAGLELRLSPRTDVDVAVRRSRLEFDQTEGFQDPLVSAFYDYTSRGVAIALRHELTPFTSVGLTIDRHRERFDLDPARDSDSLGIQSGLEFKPSAAISGKAYVGWSRVELLAPGSSSFRGLAASVDLAYTLLGATRFAVQADREVSYSAIRGQHAYLLSGVTASVNHRLGDTWDVGARTGRHSLSYGLFEVQEPGGGQGSEFDNDGEIVSEYGGEVGYRIGPDTRLGFRLDRQHRQSTIDATRVYEHTRAGLSLSYRF
jgi:hypothetical protein